MWNTVLQCCVMNFVFFLLTWFTAASRHADLVFPNETHLEGVPRFIEQPHSLYYTMKDHPATFECVAEPVSHAVVECAEKVIPYKGPDESGRLKVIRLDSLNRPDPDGMRWHLKLQIRAKEVEEWFDSYVCRCEVWNRVPELQRPKKIISKKAVIVEAYLERKFRLEPASTTVSVGQRLDISCVPPEGRPAPQVYWMKNGNRIDSVRYPHIHIHGQTKLTIESTTNLDSGNYTCVADLLGLEFRYANAVVHIKGTEKQKDTEHSETYYGSHTREIVVSAVLLLIILLVIIVSLAIVAVRKKQMKPSFRNWLFTPCCLPASRAFHKEHNGVNSHDPLLLDEYKQAWLLRNGSTVYTRKEAYSAETRTNPASPYGLTHVFTNSHVIPVQGNASSLKAAIYETLDPRVESQRPALFYSNANHRYTSDSIRTLVPPLSSVPPPPPPPPLKLDIPRSSSTLGNWMDSIPSSQYFFSGLQSQQSTKRSIVPNPNVHPSQYTHVGFKQIQTDCQLNNQNSDDIVHFPTPLEAQLSASTLLNSKSSPEGPSSASNTNTTAISSGKEEELCESPCLFSNSRKEESNLEGIVYDVCLSDQDTRSKRRSPLLDTGLSSSISNVQGRINNTGGTLQLEECAVQLSIPPGAIEDHTGEEVSLAIYHQERDKPTLQKHQTLLSPVVEFGPKQLQLCAPALVTLPHCANLKQGGWRIRVFSLDLLTQECDECSDRYAVKNYSFVDVKSTQPEYTTTLETTLERAHWKEVLVLDEELHAYKQIQPLQQDSTIGLIGYQLDSVTVHLISRKPQRLCLIGETVGSQMQKSVLENDSQSQVKDSSSPTSCTISTETDSGASKFLQLAAFSIPVTTSRLEYNTRVYVLPDTPDALNYVTELERLSDGYLVDHVKQFPFVDNGTGITFQITDVPSGWRSRLQTEKQDIPFRHIWNGTQTSTLHCSFSLENIDPTQSCISWKIKFYQGCPKNGEWSLSLPKT